MSLSSTWNNPYQVLLTTRTDHPLVTKRNWSTLLGAGLHPLLLSRQKLAANCSLLPIIIAYSIVYDVLFYGWCSFSFLVYCVMYYVCKLSVIMISATVFCMVSICLLLGRLNGHFTLASVCSYNQQGNCEGFFLQSSLILFNWMYRFLIHCTLIVRSLDFTHRTIVIFVSPGCIKRHWIPLLKTSSVSHDLIALAHQISFAFCRDKIHFNDKKM